MMDEKPIYVKVDQYKDVREILNLVRSKILEARETLEKIDNLKREEDAELEAWNAELEDVESNVAQIEINLLESVKE